LAELLGRAPRLTHPPTLFASRHDHPIPRGRQTHQTNQSSTMSQRLRETRQPRTVSQSPHLNQRKMSYFTRQSPAHKRAHQTPHDMYNYTSHKHVDISLQNSAFCHRKKTSIVVAPAHHDNTFLTKPPPKICAHILQNQRQPSCATSSSQHAAPAPGRYTCATRAARTPPRTAWIRRCVRTA
jgi:hypothetical protein